MEKFNYYFNTKKRIESVLNGPINKKTLPSVLFNLVWYSYYNISTEEKDIINYIEQWLDKKTDCFHLSAYAKAIKSYIRNMKDMPWREINDTVKIRESELEYISSFNDIKKEKLLFCYLAIAKFKDLSRSQPSHWESESDTMVFKMARVTIPSADRDYYIHELINQEPCARIYLNYKNDDTSKRIDYISDDENDKVILELDETNYYELAYTYLNWKNKGGYKKCKNCGRLFKVSIHTLSRGKPKKGERDSRAQYCISCAPQYETQYKDKDVLSDNYEAKKIICVNCGEIVYLNSYSDSRTCRCEKCQNQLLKEQWKIASQKYRDNKKDKSS